MTPRRHIIRADGRNQDLLRALTRLECALLLDADDMRQVDLGSTYPGWLLLYDFAAAGKQINEAATLLIGSLVNGDALVLPAADFGGTP
jgi:hypothetical protein